MLSDIIAAFEAQPAAIAAFKAFASACADLAEKDTNNAALHLALAVVARHYVEDFDGQPVSLDEVSSGRDTILRHARAVNAALAADAETKLSTVNGIVVSHLKAHPF